MKSLVLILFLLAGCGPLKKEIKKDCSIPPSYLSTPVLEKKNWKNATEQDLVLYILEMKKHHQTLVFQIEQIKKIQDFCSKKK